MIQHILFNNINSLRDYGLTLVKKTIGTPTPRTQIIEVPGRNGQIDLTEYLGEITYSNRPLTFEFQTVKRQEDFNKLFSKILNDLQGQIMKITLSIEEDFYYYGRIRVNEWESNKKIGSIVIEVDADPFKYRKNETVYSVEIGASGEVTANLKNLKMPTNPRFTTTNNTTIEYKEMTINTNAISNKMYDEILFNEGDNLITFKAAKGTMITVSYQEGSL